LKQPLDFIGIGIGPFNLSIAALGSEVADFNGQFFESKAQFSWHPGMMMPECQMQTSFLKDLVSAVSPTNYYSFINYLVQHKKFYRFLTTEQRTVSREEFADYLDWVASRLDSLAFSQQVERVDFDDRQRLFVVTTPQGEHCARHICLGIGKKPLLPECVSEQSAHCFHASEMALRNPDLSGKRVTIVGGGQSGADLFLNIFRAQWGLPQQLNWLSRRNNYQALDEAAFANEYFTPDYVQSFFTLNDGAKQQILAEQKMTSDGITSESLLTIYRAMYHRFEVLREPVWAHLLPSRSLTALHRQSTGYRLVTQHHLDQGREHFDSDVVIFATGYQQYRPAFLNPIAHRLQLTADRQYQITPDFTLHWDGPQDNCLFAVNASMHSHGIAEPQLSLMAWRSARILNRVLGRPQFDLTPSPSLIHWRSQCPVTRNDPSQFENMPL